MYISSLQAKGPGRFQNYQVFCTSSIPGRRAMAMGNMNRKGLAEQAEIANFAEKLWTYVGALFLPFPLRGWSRALDAAWRIDVIILWNLCIYLDRYSRFFRLTNFQKVVKILSDFCERRDIMPFPCCGKCGGNLTWQTISFGGIQGILVYCAACGAAVSWVPRPD